MMIQSVANLTRARHQLSNRFSLKTQWIVCSSACYNSEYYNGLCRWAFSLHSKLPYQDFVKHELKGSVEV